jgi:hypothetical protein
MAMKIFFKHLILTLLFLILFLAMYKSKKRAHSPNAQRLNHVGLGGESTITSYWKWVQIHFFFQATFTKF